MTRIALKHLYGTGGTGITWDKAGIFKLNLEKNKKRIFKIVAPSGPRTRYLLITGLKLLPVAPREH